MKSQNQNIKHVWSILCQSSVVDQQSNNLSIHQVLEQLNVDLSEKDRKLLNNDPKVDKVIGVPFNFQVISMWQSLNNKINPVANAEIELYDPIGQSLQKIEFKLQFEKDKPRMRSIISSPILRITNKGLYIFKVRIKEGDTNTFSEVAEIPLEVRVNNK